MLVLNVQKFNPAFTLVSECYQSKNYNWMVWGGEREEGSEINNFKKEKKKK